MQCEAVWNAMVSGESEHSQNPHAQASIRLEFFGMPRVIAGTDHAEVSGACLREVLDHAIARHPDLAGHLLETESGWLNRGYTFVVNGLFTSDPEHPVPPGADVLLVSRASGG